MKKVIRNAEYNGKSYPVEIRFSKVRSISGHFRNGKAYITVPERKSIAQAEEFLAKHSEWFGSRIEQYIREHSEKEIYFDGRKYSVDFRDGEDSVEFGNNVITVTVNLADTKKGAELLKETYLSLAHEVLKHDFAEAFEYARGALGLKKMPKLEIGYYVGFWGKCFMQKNLVKLNAHLMQASAEERRCVCLHELTHFKYADHQKYFHLQLESLIANERGINRGLRKYDVRVFEHLAEFNDNGEVFA